MLRGVRGPATLLGIDVFDAFTSSALFDRSLAEAHVQAAGVPLSKLKDWYWSLPLEERPSFSGLFDPAFYMLRYPDIAAAGVDGQMHFFEHGLREARSPHPLIDGAFLAQLRPDLFNRRTEADALLTAVTSDLVPTSPYIDLDHYLSQSARSRAGGGVFFDITQNDGVVHYTLNPLLDLAAYRARYADVPQGSYESLVHFITIGDPQARRASDGFDSEWYANAYPEIGESGFAPLYHYLRFGRHEGRPHRRIEGPARTDAGAATPIAARSGAALAADSADATLGDYTDMTSALVHVHAQKVRAVEEQDCRVAVFENDLPFGRLSLATSNAPKLTIIVPVYNGLRESFECLWSVMLSPPSVPYEMIVADDASPDEAMREFATVGGVTYVRQPQNLGFLRNCNDVFRRAKGDFVLLLNSDTQVLSGALDALYAEAVGDARIGAVGPMLLYPNGRVQEAGCVIHADGSTEMVGLTLSQNEPALLRSRDVDYCSGAALLVRRSAVAGALFDELYVPAYCEDVDLCLRIAKAGYKVRYCHTAKVVHHLSLSTKPENERRRVQLSFSNQQKMLEKWSEDFAERNEVRVFAFYLPQFHPIPENDLWWGKGFTEWRNVAKATAKYEGHYQPHVPADLGFYDLRIPEIMGQQYALARRYGIEGFCVYHYDFGGRRVLSAPIENLLKRPDIEFPFFLCWANENWTKHWDGGDRELLLEQDYGPQSALRLAADAVRMAKDRRYVRVDGRPMLLVYRPFQIPDPRAFAATIRAAFAEAGFQGVHLVYVESMEAIGRGATPADIGFDACVEFPPQGIGAPNANPTPSLPEWQGLRYDYFETVKNAAARPSAAYPRYPGVFTSWDNSPRQPVKGTTFDGATPARFQAYCEFKMAEAKAFHAGSERILFVNAWNEWAEGAHLEPDMAFGHRWLESIERAFAGTKARPALSKRGGGR